MDSTNNIGANMIIVATSNPDALDLALRIASKDSIISLFAGMPKTKILCWDLTGYTITKYLYQEVLVPRLF